MTEPTAADFVREYLTRMADIRGTGGATKETSYYSALENLLNHFGENLKPQVICNGQLRNDGVGNPTSASMHAAKCRRVSRAKARFLSAVSSK